MAVGPQDYIDRLLIKKYSQEKVDNHDASPSMIDPDKMMDAMTDYANMRKNMFALNQSLKNACSGINAMNAQYRKSVNIDKYGNAYSY